MSGRADLFEHSSSCCYLTVVDGGDPTRQVAPNRHARTSQFPGLDEQGELVVEDGESVLHDVVGPARVLFGATRTEAWQAECRIVVTDRRVVHLPGSMDVIPQTGPLGGIAMRLLQKEMTGEPRAVGQVRFEWAAWFSLTLRLDEAPRLSLTLGTADGVQDGGRDRTEPVRVVYDLPVADGDTGRAALDGLWALVGEPADETAGDLSKARAGEGTAVGAYAAASMVDGRRYRMPVKAMDKTVVTLLGRPACLACGTECTAEQRDCLSCGAPLDTLP